MQREVTGYHQLVLSTLSPLSQIFILCVSFTPFHLFTCECAFLSHCIIILFTDIKLDIHLVLSESMVWKRFSSSSSFRVPSEKKAWNSSKESFPSSAWRQRETERKAFQQHTLYLQLWDSQMFVFGFRQMLNIIAGPLETTDDIVSRLMHIETWDRTPYFMSMFFFVSLNNNCVVQTNF